MRRNNRGELRGEVTVRSSQNPHSTEFRRQASNMGRILRHRRESRRTTGKANAALSSMCATDEKPVQHNAGLGKGGRKVDA